jgi:hypothetical protein
MQREGSEIIALVRVGDFSSKWIAGQSKLWGLAVASRPV